MFLPILLVRDFGFWGWVAFAVPNVIGAAAMGFVLSPARSRAITEKHTDACLRFSDVTLAFHGFVLGWLYSRMFGWAVVVLALGLVIGLTAAMRDQSKTLGLAVKVTMVSLAVFACGLIFGWPAAWVDVFHHTQPLRLPAGDVWFFALASAAGFALCPYLDLTFHRARQNTAPGEGRASFAIGFGIVFLLMIVFTLAYAGMLRPLVTQHGSITIPTQWVAVLIVHLTLQAVFTTGLHSREVIARRGEGSWLRLALIVAVGLLLGIITHRTPIEVTDGLIHHITLGEVLYRIFLLAYGIAFPGYVFLCMIPLWFGKPSMLVRHTIWILATLAALPFGYVGFVMSQTPWILGVLLVLIVARLLLELQSPVSPTPVETGTA